MEHELRNLMKQADLRPKMVGIEVGYDGDDDGTPFTGVFIKCQCGRLVSSKKRYITIVFLVDEAIHKLCEGADTEKPDVHLMAGQVRCMFYMANAYHDRALELFVQGKQLWFK
jgi:hypothetical protein